MLASGRFKEGSELGANGSANVKLPDDSAEGMSILCRIIHLQHRDVPKQLSMSSLLDTAKLADKYEMYLAIQPTAEGWIRSSLECTSPYGPYPADDDRQTLLAVAHFFRTKVGFDLVAPQIILKNKTISRALVGTTVPGVIQQSFRNSMSPPGGQKRAG